MENVVLQCTTGASYKEYRIEPDPTLLRVVGRHGRIGSRLTPTNYQCHSLEEVSRKAANLESEKLRKGYVVISRTPVAGAPSGPASPQAAPTPQAATPEDWRLSVTATEDAQVNVLLQLAPTMVVNWSAYLAWFKVRRLPNGVGVQGRATPAADPEGAVALLAMGRLLGTQPVDPKGNFVHRAVTWTDVADMSIEVLRLVELSGLVRRPLDVSILTRGIEAASPWAGSF